jgi:hypothetical protein
MINFENGSFQSCKEWIAQQIDSGQTWEGVKSYGEDESNLNMLKDDELFPLEMTPEMWTEFVEYYRSIVVSVQIVEGEDVVAIDKGGLSNAFEIPSGYSSTWESYKKFLGTKMSPDSIANLQKSCSWILNHLSTDTRISGEIKGLVTGSVQSGKTANMEGLISMAADYDWNFFIILSGTIDNLRKQTRDRFKGDLCNSEGVLWRVLDFTAEDKKFTVDELKLNSLSGSKNFSNRYLTVCLKNRKRLEKLIDWLYSDPTRTNKLRIVVIDDEADQASINTADITPDEEQERCAINQMIVNLVNGKKSDGSTPEVKFQSMNYIAYTATPYANVLNEAPGESLYPKDFICTLPEAHEYFGAKVIFGNDEEGAPGFPIIRNIPGTEEGELKKLHKGESFRLPNSFQKSLAWFLCASAVQRIRGYKKPLSMLIHTAAVQNYHFAVYERVQYWLNHDENILALCRQVYEEEIYSVTLDDLLSANPEYGFANQVATSYPSFDEIEGEIRELLNDVRNIELGDDKSLEYGNGVHLCVDNCRANKEAEEGTYLRIVYPNDEQLAKLAKAPVFIVIGGNTLSRGLTIEGLVCTYFARTSNLADTLMQMARWFGYRKGYELLQRIWMTTAVVERFEALTKVDMDLKREVERFMKQGISPEKFGPRIRNIPEIAKFRITSKRKSQSAEYDDFDFCGDSYETTDFENGLMLQNNIKVAEDFIEKIDKNTSIRRSSVVGAWVWDNIPYKQIKEMFLGKYVVSKYSSLCNNLPYFGQWMDEMNKDGKLINWNVAVVDGDNKECPWKVSGKYQAGLVERSRKRDKKERDPNWIDIGSLRSGLDALCDVDEVNLTEEQRIHFKSVCKTRKDIISERCNFGLEDKSLLLIYRIKKDGGVPQKRSEHLREKMDAQRDIIGISIIVSGESIGESHAKTLRIRM